MKNRRWTIDLLRYGLLVACLVPVRSSSAFGAPQSEEVFTYFCTAWPLDNTKAFEATAVGDDGSTVKGSTSTPGGKYYLLTLRLTKGVQYEVEFKHGGTTVHTDADVYHARRTPSKLMMRQMSLSRPVSMSNVPAGKVLLQARTANNNFDKDRMPDIKVTSSDGGVHLRATKDPPAGVAFAFVTPGHRYTIQYNIGGKLYERTDLVPDDGSAPPVWVLEDRGSNQPVPCTYQYGPWGQCVLGRKSRSVLAAVPVGCAQSSAPVTDTTCTEAAPTPPDPIDPDGPVVIECTLWSAPVWGECADGTQHGTITGSPEGCMKDTTRACEAPPPPGAGPANSMPLAQDGSCNVWRIISVVDSTVFLNEWELEDNRRIVVKIDPPITNSMVTNGVNGLNARFKDLISVYDSVLVELICDDDSAFRIVPDPANRVRSIQSRIAPQWAWQVTAKKYPKDGTTTFRFIYKTIECGTNTLIPAGDKPFTIPVEFDPLSLWDIILAFLEKNIIRITGLLGLVAGLVAAVKKFGWFKGKGGGEEPAT